MENNSYASTAGGTSATTQSSGPSSVPLVAETGDPVPENQLKPAHSNYVPAQVLHLQVLWVEYYMFSLMGEALKSHGT